jgi:hypothetical protein
VGREKGGEKEERGSNIFSSENLKKNKNKKRMGTE